MGTPRQVLAAQAADLGQSITAYICSARVHYPYLIGVIFADAKGRFRNGATVRTSPIKRVFELSGLWACETLRGSIYVVCDWAHESTSLTSDGITH